MLSYWKLHKIPILLALVSMLFYAVLAYDLQREDFLKLIALFAALFFFLIKLIQFEKWNFKFLLVVGILFRLVFLVATPNLSQDFYRFIWDGELINQGINPYIFTPNELIENPKFQIPNSSALYDGMGSLSARHFSNYPPVNQFIFTISAFLGFGNVLGSIIWMRLLIIAADIGVVYLGRKLLQNLSQSPHLIFWYFLNPLVIIELTGNLHFEGVMLFFFVWAMYLISSGHPNKAAPIYAASIMVKLVPVLFLPLFLRRLGLKKSILFYAWVGLSGLLFLFPFYNAQFIENYFQTIGLWFSNFEFNAGIYNLVKQAAVHYFEAKPWILIKEYGTLVKILTLTLIVALALLRKHKKPSQLMNTMLLVLTTYYLLSATVHPWYLTFLLGLSIFTNYRFTILWSALVILSYYAYSQPDFKENLWLLSLEYLLVFGYLGYEIVKNHNIMATIRKKLS
ncbi:MAG: mannosyltransferase [Bacteroidota bacterium]